ncbi:MAG TPA: hypothetical protein VEY87_00175 [Gaiellaceae bacterium]|nr:hypothetical protein [Gaiellaceae bacterium]
MTSAVPPEWQSADRFEIDQLIRPVANLYRITTRGTPVAFVRQKRLALKEDIRFFAREDESEELFRIKARAVMEIGGRYDVTTPLGEPVGVLEKAFGKSLLRSTWRILGPEGQEVAVARERSVPVALLRRAIDLVPYGELVPILFHFTIDATADGAHLGDFTRAWGLRDRYTLDLSGDPGGVLDRRLAVALAIALDALQSR